MTQPWCSTPFSSPTMVGIAVPTMVWSREDRNIEAIRAPKISQIVRWLRTTSGLSGAVVAAWLMGGAFLGLG